MNEGAPADFPPLSLSPAGLLSPLRKPLQIDAQGLRCGRRAASWDQLGYYRCRWRMAAIDQLQVVADHAIFSLDGEYHDWRPAADRVLVRLHQRLVTAPQDFRPFDLEAGCLRHLLAGELPLGELASVRLEFRLGNTLTVVRRPKRDWVYCDLSEIHNVFLFLEALLAAHVPVDLDEPIGWPDATRDLQRLLQGAPRLPPATIIKR